MHPVQLFPGVQPGNSHFRPGVRRQQRRGIAAFGQVLPGKEIRAHAVALNKPFFVQPEAAKGIGQADGFPDILLAVVADGDECGQVFRFDAVTDKHGKVRAVTVVRGE